MAFFAITWQLLISDIALILLHILLTITILLPPHPMVSLQFQYWLSFAESFSYNSLLSFAFLLSLNRLSVFAAPNLARFLNTKPNIYG